MKTKKEKLKELENIIFFDLRALKDEFQWVLPIGNGEHKRDFNYHYNLLKGNLKDLFKKLK